MSRPMTHTELTALVAATSGVSVRTAQRRVLEMLKEGRVKKVEPSGLYVVTDAAEEAPQAPAAAPIPAAVLDSPLNRQAAHLVDFLLLRGVAPNNAANAVGSIYHSAGADGIPKTKAI